jgi:hypothetical protein
VDPRIDLDAFEMKKSSASPGNRDHYSSVVGPAARRYTDQAIAAP